ncbi:MAG: mechanosensitive ion channel [Myxococcales bacterium]|nr:mechanosensitive ion channel [Myxococcales bacterium]
MRFFLFYLTFACVALSSTSASANPLLNFFIQRAGKPNAQQGALNAEEQRLENRRREMVSRVENAKQRETLRKESWLREITWFRKVITDHRHPKNTWLWRETARTISLRLEIVQLSDDSISIIDKLPSALASRDQSMTLLLQVLETHLNFLHRQRNPQAELETPQNFLSLKKMRKRLRRRLTKTLQTLQRNGEELREIQAASEINQNALDLAKRALLTLPTQVPKPPVTQPATNPTSQLGNIAYQRNRLRRRLQNINRRLRFEKLRLQAELFELRLEDETLEREALRLRINTYRQMLKLLDTSIKRLSRVVEGGLFYVRKISVLPEQLATTQQKLYTLWRQVPALPSILWGSLSKQWNYQYTRWGAGLPSLIFFAVLVWLLLLWLGSIQTQRQLERLQGLTDLSETLERWRHAGLLLLTLLLRFRWLLFCWGLALFIFWTLETAKDWFDTTLLIGLALFLVRGIWLITGLFFARDPNIRWARHISKKSADRFRRRFRLLVLVTAIYIVINHFLKKSGLPIIWEEVLFLLYLCFNQTILLTLLSYREAVINTIPRERFLDRVAIIVLYHLYPLLYLGAIGLFISYIWGYRNLVYFLTWGVVGTALLFVIHHSAFWLLGELVWFALRVNPQEEANTPEKRQKLRLARLLRILLGSLLSLSFLSLALASWSIPGGLLAVPNILSFPLIEYQGRSVTILSIGYFAITLSIGIWLSRVVPRQLQDYLYPVLSLSEGAQFAFNAMTSYVIIFLSILVGLQFLGAGIGGALLLFAILGIGVGFGLQSIASNFISGLIILFGRPFSVGDHIEIGSHFGRVTKISARSTTIELPNRRLLLLPNANLLNSQVINWSAASAYRDKLTIEVTHGTDPKVVQDLLIKIAKEHKEVGAQPAPVVRLTELASNAMFFSLSITLPAPKARYRIRSELRMEISRRFQEAGISLALPKREISLEQKLKQEFFEQFHANEATSTEQASQPPKDSNDPAPQK